MALQYYLDAQDANYPYQVVIRNADGDYIGQCPMSASLGNYSKGNASVSSQAQASPLNGSPLTIRFTDYDWASCLPLPAHYGTDAAIMAYLSTLFTGQYGTLVPPTPTSTAMSIFATQSLGEINAATGDFTYYMSLNGLLKDPTNNLYTENDVAARIPADLTFAAGCMTTIITDYAADVEIVVDLMVYGAGATPVSLTIKADGVATSTGEYLATAGDLIYYRVVVPTGIGTVTVSPIMLYGTPTV